MGAYEDGAPPSATTARTFNVAGIQTIDTVGALPSLGPFISAFALLEAADLRPAAIYMHPGAWSDLLGIKEATGSAVPVLASAGGVQGMVTKSILGVPVYTSAQMPLDKIGVAQADQIVAVRRQEARVETSTDVGFEQDTVALRCISRWDLAAPNREAFVALTGITGVTLLQARRRPSRRAARSRAARYPSSRERQRPFAALDRRRHCPRRVRASPARRRRAVCARSRQWEHDGVSSYVDPCPSD